MIMNGCMGTFVKVYTLLVIMCLALISASIFLGIRIGVEKISKNIPDDYRFRFEESIRKFIDC